MRGPMGRRLVLGIAAGVVAAPRAEAQPRALPAGTVTLVVPFGAGSTNDILARLVAPELAARLGQPVVVDNRAGAGGTLGIGQVIRARPDGLTLALVSASSIPINRALFRNLAFDPARDLSLLGIAGSTPNALIVSSESGITSLEALIAKAKQPGQPPLRHFSPGNGTSQHLSCAQLAAATGITVENVPYRGPAEGVTGLLAGETNFGFASVPSVAGLLRDGRLRALATTGPRPSALPGVPTLVSLGYPGFADTDIWFGLAVARAVPAEVLALLRAALDQALADAALRERLTRAGFDAVPQRTPEQLEAFVTTQVAFWSDLVQRSGATMD
ncbi:MAG: tripartite tricarboxylate transporter substrate binding protein [Roseococcus sp.]|nr:tripartite tricarboxylate transporter substrate binding protein [Roseococcus sp.]